VLSVEHAGRISLKAPPETPGHPVRFHTPRESFSRDSRLHNFDLGKQNETHRSDPLHYLWRERVRYVKADSEEGSRRWKLGGSAGADLSGLYQLRCA